MSAKRQGVLWDAVRLAAEGAPEDQFMARAREAKDGLLDRARELWSQVMILDSMVADVAPDADWEPGLVDDGRYNKRRTSANIPCPAAFAKSTGENLGYCAGLRR